MRLLVVVHASQVLMDAPMRKLVYLICPSKACGLPSPLGRWVSAPPFRTLFASIPSHGCQQWRILVSWGFEDHSAGTKGFPSFSPFPFHPRQTPLTFTLGRRRPFWLSALGPGRGPPFHRFRPEKSRCYFTFPCHFAL